MAAYKGKDGVVYISTAAGTTSTPGSTASIGLIDTWSLNMTIENADITAYGSSFRDRKQTIKDYSLDLSGTLDRSLTEQDQILDLFDSTTPVDMGFQLYCTTGRSGEFWYGNAVPSNVTVNSAVADKVSVSFSLQGNGAINWKTTT